MKVAIIILISILVIGNILSLIQLKKVKDEMKTTKTRLVSDMASQKQEMALAESVSGQELVNALRENMKNNTEEISVKFYKK